MGWTFRRKLLQMATWQTVHKYRQFALLTKLLTVIFVCACVGIWLLGVWEVTEGQALLGGVLVLVSCCGAIALLMGRREGSTTIVEGLIEIIGEFFSAR
jgi:hypothetical protein